MPCIQLVTSAELQALPKTTRGRLQLDHVNAAITELQAVLTTKYTLLARPKSKLNEKLRRRYEQYAAAEAPEHEGAHFLTESEMRSCAALGGKGEATARLMLNSLRSLKRFRPLRANGVMTYVVVA
ncbi:C18orf24 protein-like protein [Tribonema minus]|uniref:C18orf24 protein-like protein n=1 Tax=Tribonema minus TaxID=303371 RepID=A0A835YPY4_9STRA|nr:C18orf24 protein-like protein [Tribonema minus]